MCNKHFILTWLLCFFQSGWAQTIRRVQKDFKHSIWTPFLAFPPSYLLNLPVLFTHWLPVSMPPGCFPVTFPHCVYSLSQPWRKRVGMWVNKRGESKWRWKLKVNTRGWSVTVKPPLHMWSPLCLTLSLFFPWGCWLTVVLFAARVFLKINRSGFIHARVCACGSNTYIQYCMCMTGYT